MPALKHKTNTGENKTRKGVSFKKKKKRKTKLINVDVMWVERQIGFNSCLRFFCKFLPTYM